MLILFVRNMILYAVTTEEGPALSVAHLPAHSQAYFPVDQLLEPGEDASLSPCCM